MGLLPDDTCNTLLSGTCRDIRQSIRLAPPAKNDCVGKTIQGLDVQREPIQPVLLLQRTFEDDTAKSFEKASDFYRAHTKCRVGCLDSWTPRVCQIPHPAVVRSFMRFTRREDVYIHEFIVDRVQLVKKMTEQHFTVESVWQKREWVYLRLSATPPTKQEMVAVLSGVHSDLDGCRVILKSNDTDVRIMASSRLFPSSKSRLSNATVEIEGSVEKRHVLYEIQQLEEGEAEKLVEPCRMEWSDEEDSNETKGVLSYTPSYDSSLSDRQKNSALTKSSGSNVSSASSQLPRISTPSGVRREAAEGSQRWGSIRQFVHRNTKKSPPKKQQLGSETPEDNKAYLLEYARDDRQSFRQDVIGRIVEHPAFEDCLRLLYSRCGKQAMNAAFISPISRPIHRGAASEWHWSPSLEEDRRTDVLLIDGSIPPLSLRSYQTTAVERIMMRGNCLLTAATGAGKTRIFIEVARRMLMLDPSARVVVVVPKRALTNQHKDAFEEHGFRAAGYKVGAFSGDSSASVETILKHSVIIITAEKLRNHLFERHIRFSMIQLMILDEVHNAKGESPFTAILERYKYHRPENREARIKILGLTATPTFGKNAQRRSKNFENLLEILGVREENFININDDNEEIRENIPQAETKILCVKARPDDHHLREFICGFVREAFEGLLQKHFTSLGLSELNGVRCPAYLAILSEDVTDYQFQQWRVDVTCRLNRSSVDACLKKDIEKAVFAICLMENAVQESKDLGYESAMNTLIYRLEDMMREMKSVIAECEAKDQESLFHQLYSKLHNSPYIKMMPRSVWFNGEVATPEVGQYPKFATLVEILQDYENEDEFHAMVFVRTRSAVNQMCRMLEQSPLQSSMEFKGAVGQAKSKGPDARPLAPIEQGMTQRQLQAVLAWFKEEGKRVLITTNVSEEGINVVKCELVVRYAVPLSGTEYLQSRGRARKIDSKFVCLVEDESKDNDTLRRCIIEVEGSQEMLRRRNRAQQL